ncbi:TPA: hypothetical protein N2D99_002431 [Clostridium botulinum]|nr:hypothetical protein [Clostridium botulinum]
MDKFWKDAKKEVVYLLIEFCMDEDSFKKIKSCKTKEEYLGFIDSLENESLKARLNKLRGYPSKLVEAVLLQLQSDFSKLVRDN